MEAMMVSNESLPPSCSTINMMVKYFPNRTMEESPRLQPFLQSPALKRATMLGWSSPIRDSMNQFFMNLSPLIATVKTNWKLSVALL